MSSLRNRPYYLNTINSVPSWEHPFPPPNPAGLTPVANPTLLSSYIQYADSSRGNKPFYIDAVTKEGWWVFPDAAFNDAPSAARRASSAQQQAASSAEQQGASSAQQQGVSSAQQQTASSAQYQQASSAHQQMASSAYQQGVSSAQQQLASSAEQQRASSAQQQGASSAQQQGASSAEQQGVSSAQQQGASSAEQQRASSAQQQAALLAAQQRASSAQQQQVSSAQQQQASSASAEKAAADAAKAAADELRRQQDLAAAVNSARTLEAASTTIRNSILDTLRILYSRASTPQQKTTAGQNLGAHKAAFYAKEIELLPVYNTILRLEPAFNDRSFEQVIEDSSLTAFGVKKVFNRVRGDFTYYDEQDNVVDNPESPLNRQTGTPVQQRGGAVQNRITVLPSDIEINPDPTMPTMPLSPGWAEYYTTVDRYSTYYDPTESRYFYIKAMPSAVPTYDHPYPAPYNPEDQNPVDESVYHLPDGWGKHISAINNQPYYFNYSTLYLISWAHPNPPKNSASTTPVPDATLKSTFTKYIDPLSGSPYFVNNTTFETQWDFPNSAYDPGPSASVSTARRDMASSAQQQIASSAQESSARSAYLRALQNVNVTISSRAAFELSGFVSPMIDSLVEAGSYTAAITLLTDIIHEIYGSTAYRQRDANTITLVRRLSQRLNELQTNNPDTEPSAARAASAETYYVQALESMDTNTSLRGVRDMVTAVRWAARLLSSMGSFSAAITLVTESLTEIEASTAYMVNNQEAKTLHAKLVTLKEYLISINLEATRTAATGTPATGTPAAGPPATGTPAAGPPATGTPASGGPGGPGGQWGGPGGPGGQWGGPGGPGGQWGGPGGQWGGPGGYPQMMPQMMPMFMPQPAPAAPAQPLVVVVPTGGQGSCGQTSSCCPSNKCGSCNSCGSSGLDPSMFDSILNPPASSLDLSELDASIEMLKQTTEEIKERFEEEAATQGFLDDYGFGDGYGEDLGGENANASSANAGSANAGSENAGSANAGSANAGSADPDPGFEGLGDEVAAQSGGALSSAPTIPDLQGAINSMQSLTSAMTGVAGEIGKIPGQITGVVASIATAPQTIENKLKTMMTASTSQIVDASKVAAAKAADDKLVAVNNTVSQAVRDISERVDQRLQGVSTAVDQKLSEFTTAARAQIVAMENAGSAAVEQVNAAVEQANAAVAAALANSGIPPAGISVTPPATSQITQTGTTPPAGTGTGTRTGTGTAIAIGTGTGTGTGTANDSQDKAASSAQQQRASSAQQQRASSAEVQEQVNALYRQASAAQQVASSAQQQVASSAMQQLTSSAMQQVVSSAQQQVASSAQEQLASASRLRGGSRTRSRNQKKRRGGKRKSMRKH